MADKELIRQEIERRIDLYSIAEKDDSIFARMGELSSLMDFIDSLPEENHFEDKSEMVSEDLEEAANQHSKQVFHGLLVEDNITAFKVGAEWQKKQMMKDAVTAYISLCHDYPHRRSLVAIEDSLSNFEYAEKIKLIPIKED